MRPDLESSAILAYLDDVIWRVLLQSLNDTLMGLKVINNGVSGNICQCGRGKGHVSIGKLNLSSDTRQQQATQARSRG